MKGALISLRSKSSIWTISEMRKYFDRVDDINLKEIEVNLSSKEIEVLYKGEALQHYDCIYAKGSFRYADILRTITESRFKESYMPLDPLSFTIGHDKLLTHIALNRAKIPMPGTYIASSLASAKNILNKINYPIVMKFPQGTQGKGVMYADTFASASSILDALSALKQPFLIQEFIDTGGTDIRAIVVGDKIAAAMRRIGAPRETRANIHAGGKGEPCTLDYETSKIAVDTAKAIGAEVCAVDILESPKGPLVIEANLSPGLQGITAVTKENVAGKIAKFLFERTKEYISKGKDAKTSKIFAEAGMSKRGGEQQIISNIDFRASRMLLPKVITEISGFDEKDEFVIKVENGKVTIERFG
ncbi:MAG TPA: RimK family alpha-L-glutamate ligase [Candidatus Nanoarchaeia archaeon]|nr:RimK family alpha-L-glutamate ligase [Candidatus Nanoarchaeia archaeon]